MAKTVALSWLLSDRYVETESILGSNIGVLLVNLLFVRGISPIIQHCVTTSLRYG
ncbi:uncharacterized protein METZ01_LOCUS100488 [marine metagenome]|uniref:Uncharacterized protein n=1 Tax=marine metagenome TaxID=408172 RepID=A0A381W551_9ZZZZ